MEKEGNFLGDLSDFEGSASMDGNESDLLQGGSDSEASMTAHFSSFKVNSKNGTMTEKKLETLHEGVVLGDYGGASSSSSALQKTHSNEHLVNKVTTLLSDPVWRSGN